MLQQRDAATLNPGGGVGEIQLLYPAGQILLFVWLFLGVKSVAFAVAFCREAVGGCLDLFGGCFWLFLMCVRMVLTVFAVFVTVPGCF